MTGEMQDRNSVADPDPVKSEPFVSSGSAPSPPPPRESNDNISDPSPIYQSLLILTRSNGVPCNSLEFFKIKYKNSVKETQKLGMKHDYTNFTTTNLNKFKKVKKIYYLKIVNFIY